jgi:hypothetical protein
MNGIKESQTKQKTNTTKRVAKHNITTNKNTTPW